MPIRYENLLFATSILSACALAAGCGGGEDDTCATAADCFKGQYCVQGFCQDDAPPITVNNNPANNKTPGNNQTPNNQTPGNNQTPANNQTPGNNQTPANNQTPGNNQVAAGVCTVDPFNAPTCPQSEEDKSEEPNETSSVIDATTFTPARGGCFSNSDDTYKVLSHSITRNMCSWEAADWYSQEIGSCDNRAFVATFTFSPTRACLPDEVHFEIKDVFDSRDPATWCEDPRLDCAQQDNGGWIIKMIFPKRVDGGIVAADARSKSRWNFAVSGATYAQFEYTVTVETPDLGMSE